MNEYKITYSVNGKTYTTNRVEHTEATAKRAFLKDCKEMDTTAEVLSLELIRSDACATKQQERDALEAIRKMIAELGPQSYLATAFEGCFEDAECNIENDFGDSWKRRCESAEQKLDEAEGKIKTLELDNRDLRGAIEKVKANLARAEQAAKDRALSPDDLDTVRKVLEDLAEDADRRAEQAAAEIVRFAEAPSTPEFKKAVANNRNATAYTKRIRELLGRVVAAEAAAHPQAAKENQVA